MEKLEGWSLRYTFAGKIHSEWERRWRMVFFFLLLKLACGTICPFVAKRHGYKLLARWGVVVPGVFILREMHFIVTAKNTRFI